MVSIQHSSKKHSSKKHSSRKHSSKRSGSRKPKSKKSHTKRKLSGPALVYNQVAREMGHYMPSKTKDPAEYKQVRSVYDKLKKSRGNSKVNALTLWRRAAHKVGLGIPSKHSAAGRALKKEFQCRMVKKCGTTRTPQCTKYRRGCSRRARSKKHSSKRSTK